MYVFKNDTLTYLLQFLPKAALASVALVARGLKKHILHTAQLGPFPEDMPMCDNDLTQLCTNIHPRTRQYLFRYVCVRGYHDTWCQMLEDPCVDVTDANNMAVALAAVYGYDDIVARLMSRPGVEPSANHQLALRWASKKGHLAVTNRLLLDNRVDLTVLGQEPLKLAVEHGHLEVVRRLLRDERTNPRIYFNHGFSNPKCEHEEVMVLLFNTKRVRAARFQPYQKNNLLNTILVYGWDRLLRLVFDRFPRLVIHLGHVEDALSFWNFRTFTASHTRLFRLAKTRARITTEAQQYVLDKATKHGQSELVRLFIKDTTLLTPRVLYEAIRGYHTDLVELLLSNRKSLKRVNTSRVWKLYKDHSMEKDTDAALLRVLLRFFNPNNSNVLLASACIQGCDAVLRLLLKDTRINPLEGNNLALRWAFSYDRPTFARLLLQHPKVKLHMVCDRDIKQAIEHGSMNLVAEMLEQRRKKFTPHALRPFERNSSNVLRPFTTR